MDSTSPVSSYVRLMTDIAPAEDSVSSRTMAHTSNTVLLRAIVHDFRKKKILRDGRNFFF